MKTKQQTQTQTDIPSVNGSRGVLMKKPTNGLVKQENATHALSTNLSGEDVKGIMDDIGQVSSGMLEAITESLKGCGGEGEYTERITIEIE